MPTGVCVCLAGNEHDSCTYIKASTGELYDDDCTTRMPFLCKSYRIDYVPEPKVKFLVEVNANY